MKKHKILKDFDKIMIQQLTTTHSPLFLDVISKYINGKLNPLVITCDVKNENIDDWFPEVISTAFELSNGKVFNAEYLFKDKEEYLKHITKQNKGKEAIQFSKDYDLLKKEIEYSDFDSKLTEKMAMDFCVNLLKLYDISINPDLEIKVLLETLTGRQIQRSMVILNKNNYNLRQVFMNSGGTIKLGNMFVLRKEFKTGILYMTSTACYFYTNKELHEVYSVFKQSQRQCVSNMYQLIKQYRLNTQLVEITKCINMTYSTSINRI